MSKSLQVLSDERGTIVTGFVARDVYYVRFVDFASTGLGIRCGSQIRQQLADAKRVSAFFDISGGQGADFGGRSAIMRALMANRRHLAAITILVGSGPVATRARALMAMLGGEMQITDSPAVFQARMLEAAPTAPATLPASGRLPVAKSVRPRARSVRPRAHSGTHG